MIKVTEMDFRKPEFVGENPDDYERRPDGKIVRKDRWEDFADAVASGVGMNVIDFELGDVFNEVKKNILDAEILDWLLSYNGNIVQERFRQSILQEIVANSSQPVDLRVRMVQCINWN